MAARAEDDQPIRVVDRQRLQDQRVDEREDGDVGADAERQREQGHAADDRRPAHLPEGECQVTAERRHQSHGPFDGQILQHGWPVLTRSYREVWCQWHRARLLSALEGQAGPGLVDRAHLVIHPAGGEARLSNDVAVEVGIHARRFLWPRPARASAIVDALQRKQVRLQLAVAGRSRERGPPSPSGRAVKVTLAGIGFRVPAKPFGEASSATLNPGLTPSFLTVGVPHSVVIGNDRILRRFGDRLGQRGLDAAPRRVGRIRQQQPWSS